MNKNNINILVIISILFCSMLIFPFNAHAETTNVGSAGGIPNNKDYNLNYDGNVCDNENIKSAVKIVGKTISILQIAVPIILVVMALVDITKSIVSMDDSKSKKSINMLIKRLIAAVLVFFIIVIVKFICQLIVGDAMESCLNYIVNPW